MTIPDFVTQDLRTLGIHLPEGTLPRLERYLDLLLETNQRMNLTAIKDRDLAWRRLILDSLTPLPLLERPLADEAPVRTLIDIGSGGGMPGIPLAIARPDLQVTLLEATGKKVAFHNEAIAALGLANCKSIHDRAEKLGHDKAHRQKYDIAISRAVGVMSLILEYSVPFVRVGGRVVAMKGPRIEQELEEGSDALQLLALDEVRIEPAWPESFGNDLVIFEATKMESTPKTYPRDGAVMGKNPL